MDFGSQIKRDSCPEKYWKKGNFFVDILPVFAASLVVAVLSGDMFTGGGLHIAATIAIEAVVVLALTGTMYFITNGQKKRFAQTYISVCEGGVQGVCPVSGFKCKDFAIPYSQIQKVTAKGDRLTIVSAQGTYIVTVGDAQNTCTLIQRMCNM